MSRQGKRIASARRRVRISAANRRMAKNQPKLEVTLPKKSQKLKVKTSEIVEPQVKVQVILPSSAPIQPPVAQKAKASAKRNGFFDIKASGSKKEKDKNLSPSRNVAAFTKKPAMNSPKTSVAAPQSSPTFIIPATTKNKPSTPEPTPQPATHQPILLGPIVSSSVVSSPVSPEPHTPKVSAKVMKEEAIKKAVAATKSHFSGKKRRDTKELRAEQFGWQRLVLAFTSSLVLVFAIIYFVNLNAPDVSLKVAAMQTGIDASYPNYTPRDFTLTDITSENGKITLNFKNLDTDASYTLVEENSAWDTTTLYNNFVKPTYGDDYTMVREQGLTIYINRNANAVWVNGGVFYQISVKSGSLTKKQITTIATSL